MEKMCCTLCGAEVERESLGKHELCICPTCHEDSTVLTEANAMELLERNFSKQLTYEQLQLYIHVAIDVGLEYPALTQSVLKLLSHKIPMTTVPVSQYPLTFGEFAEWYAVHKKFEDRYKGYINILQS